MADQNKLQREIRKRVQNKVFPLLEAYNLSTRDLEDVLLWKPIVLILGNYSSGKSTLVNELLGQEVQRTGQAPTDDSFTILTAPGRDERAGTIPGMTLVNDDTLPFTSLKAYGDHLISHFSMRQLDFEILKDLAIIDTPGMLDSVTEKGRGYDFAGVIGQFAKLADLVVLMFDPHKAGTIKETYTTIRSTLPETSEEDRILYVMSRIDECDNIADLIRSYGTLCWNLSQMTGRKDIPRIFLTFAPDVIQHNHQLDIWIDERNQIKQKILDVPKLKISHVLHLVDKKLFETRMVAEAMENFASGGRRLFNKALKNGLIVGPGVFFFLDLIVFSIAGIPQNAFLTALISGAIGPLNLIVPTLGLLGTLGVASLCFLRWGFPKYRSLCCSDVDRLAQLDSHYRSETWHRRKESVLGLLKDAGVKSIYVAHKKNLERIEKISQEELKKYFSRIRKATVSRKRKSTAGQAADGQPNANSIN
ncbi:MAG: dynamin family protein [Deltaproteobacteria bacterium]|nr:dynamin family protein [Deltaproteobacteria bacterium]